MADLIVSTDDTNVTVIESETIVPELAIATVNETEIVETTSENQDIIVSEDETTEILECANVLVTHVYEQGAGGGGALFITGVAPTTSGNVGLYSYIADTNPADYVITQCTTDTDDVTITALVEGNSSLFTPTVVIDGNTIPPASLTKLDGDTRNYTASYPITVSATRTVTVSMNDEQYTAEVIINRAAAGPSISDIQFGTYPNSQTALKEGDQIQLTFTCDPEATSVTVDQGVLDAKTITGSGPTISGSFTVSNISNGSHYVTAHATNSLNTDGSDYTSSGSLTIDQDSPSVETINVAYPGSQTAIKSGDSVTLTSEVLDYTSIQYTGSAYITAVPNDTTYENQKTVSYASGGYVPTGTMYSITAYKSSNGTQTTKSATIAIANTPAQITIYFSGTPAALRSSPYPGETYTAYLTADQGVLTYDSLTADKGVLDASFYNTNRKDLKIDDDVTKGTGTFTAALTNRAGIQTTTITSGETYTVAGFTPKVLTFAAYSRIADIGTPVVNTANVVVLLTGTSSYYDFVANTTTGQVQKFTITDSGSTYDPNGDYLFINDDYVTTNTEGTLQYTIEETV